MKALPLNSAMNWLDKLALPRFRPAFGLAMPDRDFGYPFGGDIGLMEAAGWSLESAPLTRTTAGQGIEWT
jgi:hypothetical protein